MAEQAEVRTVKPVFTASEILTIYEMASRFDRSKPGYADVKDIDPIKEKIVGWFENAAPGQTLR